MQTTKTMLSPLEASDRIQSLDIMRGIVLFGILLMNINGMGLSGAYGDPTVSGGATGWNLVTWITTNMLFEGTMRALFSLLFGVGMFIFLDRLEKKGAGIKAANIYFRRLIWLLIFGLINAYILLWYGDILFSYALMGFFVFSFRNLPPKKLVLASIILFSIGTLWNYSDYLRDVKFMENVALIESYTSEGKELTKELIEVEYKWNEIKWSKSETGIENNNDNMRKSYLSALKYLAPINKHFNEHFPLRYDLWDILSMMLMGIAFFKLKILTSEKSYRFYIVMVLIGYAVGLSVNYYETKLILDDNFSLLAFSKSNITYDLGRVFVAIGHVGLIMLFCKLTLFKNFKYALSCVGRMALTNYLMHSLIALLLFTGAGFGLFGTFERHELLYMVFSIWLFQIIISPIWLKYYQFGPLEWIWRNLSYLTRYPLKK